jgi:hypothetical protein
VLLLRTGLRAGIGVTGEGVVVRSLSGRCRWASWSEIERFEIVRPPNTRGGRAIAVVRRTGRPLIAHGCSYEPWTKWSKSTVLPDLLHALENERIAALRPLNGATMDRGALRISAGSSDR